MIRTKKLFTYKSQNISDLTLTSLHKKHQPNKLCEGLVKLKSPAWHTIDDIVLYHFVHMK